MEWYKWKCPKDNICKHNHKELILQTQRKIQGKKDAGKMWYNLLTSVFTTLNIIRSSSDHGIFTWKYTGDHNDFFCKNNSVSYNAIICLATDDIILFTDNIICFQRLQIEFNPIFEYSIQNHSVLTFLNIHIIQSNYGIIIDQTKHIISNIINPYWKDKNTSSIPWESYPFHTESSFETELFNYLLISDKDKKSQIEIHNGSLEKWIGSLLHVKQVT